MASLLKQVATPGSRGSSSIGAAVLATVLSYWDLGTEHVLGVHLAARATGAALAWGQDA